MNVLEKGRQRKIQHTEEAMWPRWQRLEGRDQPQNTECQQLPELGRVKEWISPWSQQSKHSPSFLPAENDFGLVNDERIDFRFWSHQFVFICFSSHRKPRHWWWLRTLFSQASISLIEEEKGKWRNRKKNEETQGKQEIKEDCRRRGREDKNQEKSGRSKSLNGIGPVGSGLGRSTHGL